MAKRGLTTPSYLVLGMVELLGSATPYELKQFAALTVKNFWSLPHTQIYTLCDRLLADGLLAEEREEMGRRRRRFTITKNGVRELDRWRTSEAEDLIEMRDLATLKMFFGADPKRLAEQQIEVHERHLASYLALKKAGAIPGGPSLALDSGIAIERAILNIWKTHLK
jgi:DNA-binding PadR family transcriptional regulator